MSEAPPARARHPLVQLADDVRALMRLTSHRPGAGVAIGVLGLALSLADGGGLGVALLFVYRLFGARAVLGDAGSVGMERLLALAPPGAGGIWMLGALSAGLFLLRTAASAAYGVIASDLATTAGHRSRLAVFAALMHGDYAQVSGLGAGLMLNALEWEVTFVPELVVGVTQAFADLCALAVYGVLLTLVSWKLSLSCALLAAVPLTTALAPGRLLSRLSARMLDAVRALSRHTVASVHGLRTLRLFGAQASRTARYARLSDEARASAQRLAVATQAIGAGSQLLRLAGFGVFLAVARSLGVELTTLLAFIALLYRLMPHVSSVEQRLSTIIRDRAVFQALVKVVDIPRAHSGAGAGPFPSVFSELRLDRVSYDYAADGVSGVRDVSLVLRRGELVTLKGESGGGKTTLVSLLSRLFTPTQGGLFIDGVSAEAISPASWSARVAVTGQDLELLEGSVLDNITFDRPEVGRAEAELALATAGADFVDALPQGVDTPVGDRGLRLSGGQRQRLTLARALAGRPAVLIMDEATNALQPQMERAIHARIRDAYPDLTLLVITHRSEVDRSDRLLTLSGGALRPAREVAPEPAA